MHRCSQTIGAQAHGIDRVSELEATPASTPASADTSSIFRKAVRVFASCAALFLLLNISLILVDFPKIDSYPALHVKKLRYSSMNNVFRSEGYSRFWINRYGLADIEPAPVDDRSIFRIAFLGDSYVEAVQVSQKARFSNLVPRLLPTPSGHRTIEGWNYGFSGDNTGNAYARWKYLAQQIGFNRAVFAFTDQDLTENQAVDVSGPSGAFLRHESGHGYQLDESRIPTDIRQFEWELKGIFGRLFNSLYQLRVRTTELLTRERARYARLFRQLDQRAAPGAASPATIKHAVKPNAANETCEQLKFVYGQILRSGTPTIILGLPSAHTVFPKEYDADPSRRNGYRDVMACLRHAGIEVADPLEQIEESIQHGRDPYRDWTQPGGHYNELGHRIIAEVLAQSLTDQTTKLSGAK